MQGLMSLSDKEFQLIRDLVYSRFGINLTEQKRSLVVGRLNSLLRRKNIESFKDYYEKVMSDSSGALISELIDKISTNHTFFNREKDHFDYFVKTTLPELEARPLGGLGKTLKIWVAGSSSGEEPYMLAMLLREYFGNQISSWDVGILATDISTSSLQKAVTGLYTDENVSKLPKNLLSKYFKKQNDGMWMIDQKLKDMVLYRRLNLMQETYPFKGKFHIIFCRNVMIYFDIPTRQGLVARFHRYMHPRGYLFIGHSETLGRTGHPFNYLMPAVYRKGDV